MAATLAGLLTVLGTGGGGASRADLVGASAPTPDAAPGTEWLRRVETGGPGNLPLPRPLLATYRASWNSIDAAEAEVNLRRSGRGGEEIVMQVNARTIGLPRTLWQMDGTEVATARAADLRPLRVEQTERRSGREDSVRVEFNGASAVRTSRRTKAGQPPEVSVKTYAFPGLRDAHTALLYLRSLPLAPGEEHAVICMYAKNPYLVSVRVVERGAAVRVPAGSFRAVILDLDLTKIDDQGRLQPHRKFRGARVWLSDDADRVPLRVSAQTFVGKINMDLIALSFPGARPGAPTVAVVGSDAAAATTPGPGPGSTP